MGLNGGPRVLNYRGGATFRVREKVRTQTHRREKREKEQVHLSPTRTRCKAMHS